MNQYKPMANDKPNYAYKATITAPAVATTSSIVLAANPERLGVLIYNNTGVIVYISYGAVANANTNLITQIANNGSWQMLYPIYMGAITAIRATGMAGNLVITELKLV